MQFDLDPIWPVMTLFVYQDVPAGDNKQARRALEEEATCVRKRLLLAESANSGGCDE
jgi:hypothetical protein